LDSLERLSLLRASKRKNERTLNERDDDDDNARRSSVGNRDDNKEKKKHVGNQRE
jgi:hypothetical protein